MAVTQREQERQVPEPGADPIPWVTAGLFVLVVVIAAVWLVRSADVGPAVTAPPEAVPTTLATPPSPVNAAPGTPDFDAVVRSIVTTANDLRVHPNPAGLTSYLDPANPSYADALSSQGRLASGELRYDPAPSTPVVAAVRVLSSSASTAMVDVTMTSPRYRVVDRGGSVVSDTPGGTGSARWTLRLGDGTWRLVEAVSL